MNAPLTIVCCLALCLCASSTRADENQKLVPSITVVGSAQAAARPDMAEITIGMITQSEQASVALKENSEAMERLLQTLKSRDIADKDLQTSGFSVSPQYRQRQLPRGGDLLDVIGYQVSNQVHVKVRQLSSLGPLLDDLVAKGANQVHGISFAVAEPAPIQDEARRKALSDARRKAELYAHEAGVKLGRVLLVQETTPHNPQPLFRGAVAAPMMAAVPVAAGELEFHASLTVTYAID